MRFPFHPIFHHTPWVALAILAVLLAGCGGGGGSSASSATPPDSGDPSDPGAGADLSVEEVVSILYDKTYDWDNGIIVEAKVSAENIDTDEVEEVAVSLEITNPEITESYFQETVTVSLEPDENGNIIARFEAGDAIPYWRSYYDSDAEVYRPAVLHDSFRDARFVLTVGDVEGEPITNNTLEVFTEYYNAKVMGDPDIRTFSDDADESVPEGASYRLGPVMAFNPAGTNRFAVSFDVIYPELGRYEIFDDDEASFTVTVLSGDGSEEIATGDYALYVSAVSERGYQNLTDWAHIPYWHFHYDGTPESPHDWDQDVMVRIDLEGAVYEYFIDYQDLDDGIREMRTSNNDNPAPSANG